MKKILLPLIMTVAIAGLAVLSTSLKSTGGLKIGDVAPDFELMNVDGKKVSLSDYNDKEGVIVVFTCNHCPFAKMWEDRIMDLDVKYAESGWSVVAINPNDPSVVPSDSYEKMKERASEKGYTFPYLFDEGQKVYPTYGATKTPHVYLLKRHGDRFKVEYIGAIDDNHKSAKSVKTKYVEDAIKALKNGKKPKITEAKAIGCSIKKK